MMDDTLADKLEALRLKRERKLHELEGIEDQIAILLMTRQKVKHRDLNGNVLRVGDKVETVLKLGYNERKGKIISIKDDKVTIEFLKSKNRTWRKGRNLVKIV